MKGVGFLAIVVGLIYGMALSEGAGGSPAIPAALVLGGLALFVVGRFRDH